MHEGVLECGDDDKGDQSSGCGKGEGGSILKLDVSFFMIWVRTEVTPALRSEHGAHKSSTNFSRRELGCDDCR